MHIILGAGGPVANALSTELLKNNQSVRLVSRRPVTQFASATWEKADLKNINEVLQAVKGASHIYMTAGLKYDKKVWAEEWPLIVQNLVDATRETGARLLFFDNVYMYGLVKGPMTEETPYHPASKKGEIRAKIAQKIMDASKNGTINATIARAADFYGAESLNSFYDSMVLQKYAKGEKAMWLGNPDTRHCFTYVPDAGKAMYILGQQSNSSNQVWHVPTAPSLTGREFIEYAAKVFNREPRFTKVNKFMLQAIGFFNPVIRETAEMYYQYNYDYIFDSSKFDTAFGIKATSYKDGITELSQGVFKPAN